jgi:hypothetical protein
MDDGVQAPTRPLGSVERGEQRLWIHHISIAAGALACGLGLRAAGDVGDGHEPQGSRRILEDEPAALGRIARAHVRGDVGQRHHGAGGR